MPTNLQKQSMRIGLLCVGKTLDARLLEMTKEYEKKLPAHIHYTKTEIVLSKTAKNKDQSSLLKEEKDKILTHLNKNDILVLLDENGKEFSSQLFADFIQEKLVSSTKSLVFVVGGAYGFHEDLYALAKHKISLSKMTFTHQMVRLFFTEQLYRAFSILNNKPYHHE